MRPNYANLSVGYVEEQIFKQFDGPKPELFCRYIDDCLGATSAPGQRRIGTIYLLCQLFPPSPQIYREILKPQSLFSISTFLSKTTIQATSVYYKPTDSHSYLLYSSSHPSHVKDPIPYSQFLRLRRLCSDDLDFNSKYDEMSNFFSERGYPYILSKALNHVQNVNRETAVEPSTSNNEERIPFTFFSLSTLTIYPPEARNS